MSALAPHIILAPLQGVTQLAFRRTYVRHFSGVAAAVAPFVATVAGSRIKPSHLREIDPPANDFMPLVPQVLSKSPTELRTMLRAMRALGYRRCDLNAGCPWPMVVRKGRGAGLLRQPALLRQLLEVGCEEMPQGFSLKARLGIDNFELLPELMEMLNTLPLCRITVHARCATQRYAGHVNLEKFEEVLAATQHEVCYNGDIRTVNDFIRLRQRLPSIRSWMLGRGIISDPFLPEALCAGKRPVTVERLRAFHDDYLETLQGELSGPAPLLGRLKEFWSYLHERIADGAVMWRRIRTCRDFDTYQRLLSMWWSHAPALVPLSDGIVSSQQPHS